MIATIDLNCDESTTIDRVRFKPESKEKTVDLEVGAFSVEFNELPLDNFAVEQFIGEKVATDNASLSKVTTLLERSAHIAWRGQGKVGSRHETVAFVDSGIFWMW
jgi:hypothetical protein